MKKEAEQAERYDVIIAGGGMAGLGLARQLKRWRMDLAILVLEKIERPLPPAAFKVGESSVEAGAHYFRDTVGIGDHLRKKQLFKLGLRFFHQSESDDFASRPEFGLARFPAADSFQIDRGEFETHLREVVLEDGVDLKEGVNVRDIVLHDGDEDHEVTYLDTEGEMVTRRARWVVDATGRRRLLQRKLGLGKPSKRPMSSSWFRVVGKVDVDTWVPDSNTEWHGRVEGKRWLSTNHLLGEGYWVWLIPLAPDNSSIGIVTDERIHPFKEYNTLERAMVWLKKHEPVLAEHLAGNEVLDFRVMRKYSYSSSQVFSIDRWACIGEAGMFIDPYYSVGTNMIGFSNGFAQEMIERDLAGELTQAFVDHANQFYLSINESLTHNIQLAYVFYHHPQVMALKTLWDFCFGWAIADPQLYHETYLDVKLSNVISNLITRIVVSQARMMEVFIKWAETPPENFSFDFEYLDYIAHMPIIRNLLTDNLPKENKSKGEILADFRRSAERIEEVAQVIFFMAVEQVFPEKLSMFPAPRWINIQAISLDPDRWQADGLFEPQTPARDLTPVDAEIRSLFRQRVEAAAE